MHLKPAGSSAIGFGEPSFIPDRIRNMTTAYLAGHEIGTHALGHFCGSGGVGDWSSADWSSEMKQFNKFRNGAVILCPHNLLRQRDVRFFIATTEGGGKFTGNSVACTNAITCVQIRPVSRACRS